jgi:serine/threonine protein kinase
MQAAAPEVLLAAESNTPVLAADTATDIWALGVIAFELISSQHLFPPGTSQATIRGAIFGAKPMPWENIPEHRRTPLQASVMKCFAREPTERPRAATLAAEWRELVAYGLADVSGGVVDVSTGVTEARSSSRGGSHSSSGSESGSEGIVTRTVTKTDTLKTGKGTA